MQKNRRKIGKKEEKKVARSDVRVRDYLKYHFLGAGGIFFVIGLRRLRIFFVKGLNEAVKGLKIWIKKNR